VFCGVLFTFMFICGIIKAQLIRELTT